MIPKPYSEMEPACSIHIKGQCRGFPRTSTMFHLLQTQSTADTSGFISQHPGALKSGRASCAGASAATHHPTETDATDPADKVLTTQLESISNDGREITHTHTHAEDLSAEAISNQKHACSSLTSDTLGLSVQEGLGPKQALLHRRNKKLAAGCSQLKTTNILSSSQLMMRVVLEMLDTIRPLSQTALRTDYLFRLKLFCQSCLAGRKKMLHQKISCRFLIIISALWTASSS